MKTLLKMAAILVCIEVLVTLAIPYLDAQGFAIPSIMIYMASLLLIATPLIYFTCRKPKPRRIFS